jgi:hypothetical protein
MAKVDVGHQARQVTFSLVCGTMIGFLETLTIAGAVLMVAHEDIGSANGLQYTIRGTLSAISSKYTLETHESTANVLKSFSIRDDCE